MSWLAEPSEFRSLYCRNCNPGNDARDGSRAAPGSEILVLIWATDTRETVEAPGSPIPQTVLGSSKHRDRQRIPELLGRDAFWKDIPCSRTTRTRACGEGNIRSDPSPPCAMSKLLVTRDLKLDMPSTCRLQESGWDWRGRHVLDQFLALMRHH